MTAIETELHPFVQTIRCTVALPVLDKSADLDASLNALFSQVDRHGRPLEPDSVTVVLAYDGDCRLGRIARSWQARHPESLHLFEFPNPDGPESDGALRQFAMECAAMIAGQDPVLFTEPGVVVALDWADANIAALNTGADIVAGVVVATSDSDPQIMAYRMLLAEIDARLDPQAHDPWPRHGAFSFASFAVSAAAAYRPELRQILQSGPANAARLLRQTALRVRHALEPQVTGTAAVFDAPPVGPAFRAFSRARWRGEMRRHHAQGADVVAAWESRLRVQPGALAEEWRTLTFDALWDRAEQISPLLAHRRLNAVDLPHETKQATNLLAGLRSADPAPRPSRRIAVPGAPVRRHAAAAA